MNSNQQAPDAEELDIFNSSSVKASPEEKISPQTQTAKLAKVDGRSSFMDKIKPIHFVIVPLVVAIVIIAGRQMFHSGNSVPDNMLQPQTAMVSPTAQQPRPPTQNAPVPAQAPVQPEALQVPSENEAQLNALTQDIHGLSGTTTSLQAQVKELQAKVALLESKAATPPAATPKPVPKKVVHHKVTPPRPAAQSTASSGPVAKPGDFTVNTIFRDQAWIQNSERTYVVQAGDVVNGLKIIRIDPNSRRVVTNNGTIR